MPSETTFAAHLRRARMARGLTQEALAEKAGLSERAISSLERGVNRAPRRDTLDLLVCALDLSDEERREWVRTLRRERAASLVPPSAERPTSQPVHLPTPITEIVGRERELADISHLLSTHRLITLTGTGGIGKTRMAVAVGHRLAHEFPGGIAFADLSPLHNPTHVLPTIAAIFGVQDTGTRPILTALIDALDDRRILLVADNLEHVIDAAADLGRLVSYCPRLTLLATSREPLRLTGEIEYAVPPLPVPDMSLGVGRLRENPSVALFDERAQAVRAGFDLTPENAATVVAICQRLEGLPLAVELAAARVRSLPVNQLLERLAHPLRFLAGGARDLPARQQTIRNTIQWSYDLLSADEQRLFRRLAVFVGGWTLETAETVVNIDGDLGIDVLDGLLSLVEKSLVVQHERIDGTLRYRLLVPIREFAGEQLDQHGETVALRQRHARAIRDLVQWDFEYLQELDYDWLDRVGAEHDNVRAALTWASERDGIDLGIEIAGRLGWYWYIKGYLRDGAEWTSAFLARHLMRDEQRGRALIGLSIVRTGLGDYDGAEHASAEAVAIGLEVDDVVLVTEGLLLQAVAMVNVQHREDADIEGVFAEAYRLAEANAFSYCMANTLQAWAGYGVRVGRYDRAEELFHRSIAVGGTIGTQSRAWCGLGRIALLLGDDDAAIGHCREALLVNRSAYHLPAMIDTLEILATVLLRNGLAGIAATLLAVIDRERRQKGFKQGIGIFPDKVSEEVFHQLLDPATFAEAWRAGAAMSLEEGIAFALDTTED